MNPTNSTPDWDEETIPVDAILYEQLHVSSRWEMKQVCESRLKSSAENLDVDFQGHKVVYGNSQGLGLLEDINELRRDMTILKSQMAALAMRDAKRETEKKESSEEMLALKGTVTRLVNSSESYLAIRRRYIAVYQRDFKGTDDLKGSDAVNNGNLKAHTGDAVADAIVFDRDINLDTKLYEEWYGLQYAKVLEWNDSGIDDGGLFRLLNVYATTVTQGTTSQELMGAFDSFIHRVKESWLQAPNQAEPNTPLNFAYYNFWKKHKESASRRTSY